MAQQGFSRTYDAGLQNLFMKQLKENALESALKTLERFLPPSLHSTKENVDYLVVQREGYKMLAEATIGRINEESDKLDKGLKQHANETRDTLLFPV